jgi:hypothetical protein
MTPNAQITSGNPAEQTITAASAASLPVVLFGAMATTSAAINPRSVDPAMDELTAEVNLYGHRKIYNPGDTPADHTYDMDDEGINAIVSGYLVFT